MSLNFDAAGWLTALTSWLEMINDSSHGVIDLLIAFAIAGASLLSLYSYMHKNTQ